MSYDYLYCFDSQDHLICARNCVDDKFGKKLSISEYILYIDGLEIGIKYHTFSDDLCFIEQISECRYKDGRLVEYLLANILPVVSGATISGLECTEISYEKYHFLADRLQSCFESKYYSDYNGKRFIASENIYYFIYDETGEISKYKVTPYKDGVRDDFYTETFYSVRRPPTKNSKSRQKETLNADNTVNYLKKRIKTDVLDIRKAWDVFKAFCRLPLVGEDEKAILFQCGVHNFTGKSLFHYSFVRQFDAYQKKEDVWQMVQLHCEYTFKVTAELKKLLASEFYFGSDGDIDNYFKRIESLPEFQIPQREKPLHLSIYQELVD
jgi:hypothetical protein